MNNVVSVGLYTAKYAYFAAPHDLVSPGLENVWIAEVGSATLNGTFDSFKRTLADSVVGGGSYSVDLRIVQINDVVSAHFQITVDFSREDDQDR